MIAIDWGSSSLRAYRLDAVGGILEQRRSDQGVLHCQGGFSSVMVKLIADWDDPAILLSGMIGSRSGWREMPYLDCPVGVHALAAALEPMHIPELPGRTLWFVPGVADQSSASVPDVVRGEETQLCGLLDALQQGTHVACLPGTHSKWIVVRDGRILSINTAMTGEIFAVLRQHSLLAKLMGNEDSRFDAFAFDRGLQRSAEAGGLLHHLFGVRTAGLFGQFTEAALPWYLSGLLIGHEVRASELFSRTPRPAQVHLVGSDRLLTAYARTLLALGIGVQRHPEHLAANGMHALWQLRSRAE